MKPECDSELFRGLLKTASGDATEAFQTQGSPATPAGAK